MNINLTPIIQAIIGLLAAIITYKLIPWIKARTTESQQKQIKAVIRIAVFAAEQIIGAGNGKAKLDYAQKWLADHGYDVSIEEIEATVYEELNILKGGIAISSTIETDVETPTET